MEPIAMQAAYTDPRTGAALPADVQAFMHATGATFVADAEWTPIADIAGGGISFPDVMKDAAYTYILGQIGGNFLSICKLQGGALVSAVVVPSPGTLRSGAFGGAGGEVYSDFHGEGHTALLERYLIPGWQEPSGGPGPGPGPGGVTRDEVAQMISDALVHFQGGQAMTDADLARIVGAFDTALRTAGTQLNTDVQRYLEAVFSRAGLQADIQHAVTAAVNNLDISDKNTRLGQSFFDQERNITGAQVWEEQIRSGLVAPGVAPDWVRNLPGFPWGRTLASETHEHTNADERAAEPHGDAE